MKPKNWKKYLKITHIQPITRALKIDAQFCINTQLLRPETNILSKNQSIVKQLPEAQMCQNRLDYAKL